MGNSVPGCEEEKTRSEMPRKSLGEGLASAYGADKTVPLIQSRGCPGIGAACIRDSWLMLGGLVSLGGPGFMGGLSQGLVGIMIIHSFNKHPLDSYCVAGSEAESLRRGRQAVDSINM